MATFRDSGHRPHADHRGEYPRLTIDEGPNNIKVELLTWGPQRGLFPALYDELQANWGEEPSHLAAEFADAVKASENDPEFHAPVDPLLAKTGWLWMTDEQRAYVERCFAGQTLQQPLEGIIFKFCIDGVSRAFTHQEVRTRIGAGFMQHGGRDNDWRHRNWRMPETVRRACRDYGTGKTTDAIRLPGCVTDWAPIERYLEDAPCQPDGLRKSIEDYLMDGKRLYSALVDAGIPWQDARRVLPMGTETYIFSTYNYVAMAGFLANRLEPVMDWEINCVAQLMVRELKMKCPPLLSKYIGSHSDRAGAARFAGLSSWPPDGKYPVPAELADLPRQHRAEQMPYFILSPAAMNGGPIEWIATNGTWPEELKEE